MGFESFLTLLVISVAVSGILHYGVKFYVTTGTWSFIAKCVVGYVGAMLGAYFFGSWGYSYGDVSIIPAILGSAAMLIIVIDVAKIWVGRTE
ncbi:MAG: hypothetical protein IH995_09660 [Proteobacteria bacterium]|nr:hypothetical protein [Pseudomonadota bacterium]